MINERRWQALHLQVSGHLQVVDTESNLQWYLYNNIIKKAVCDRRSRLTGAEMMVMQLLSGWSTTRDAPSRPRDPSLGHCKRRSNCSAEHPTSLSLTPRRLLPFCLADNLRPEPKTQIRNLIDFRRRAIFHGTKLLSGPRRRRDFFERRNRRLLGMPYRGPTFKQNSGDGRIDGI